MHDWSDETVDWQGINYSARYIGQNLKKWGRVGVRDYKEKYGIVRVYCSLGWHQLHSITHPGHCFSRYPKWLWILDCKYGTKIIPFLFNWFIIPYHIWLYKKLYKDMILKYPHLKKEIICGADFPELLKLKDNKKRVKYLPVDDKLSFEINILRLLKKYELIGKNSHIQKCIIEVNVDLLPKINIEERFIKEKK